VEPLSVFAWERRKERGPLWFDDEDKLPGRLIITSKKWNGGLPYVSVLKSVFGGVWGVRSKKCSKEHIWRGLGEKTGVKGLPRN